MSNCKCPKCKTRIIKFSNIIYNEILIGVDYYKYYCNTCQKIIEYISIVNSHKDYCTVRIECCIDNDCDIFANELLKYMNVYRDYIDANNRKQYLLDNLPKFFKTPEVELILKL